MLSSGIFDLAIGLAFVFGATAALCSVITELISRFLGLRGAYLLLGLRELLDGKNTSVDLGLAAADFGHARGIITATGAEAAPSSATSALMGSPILASQGMTGTISTRKLTMPKPAATPADDSNKRASLPKSGNPLRTWSMRRSLPSYISARSFGEAVIDLVIPDASGQTNMGEIQNGINRLPESMSTLKASLQSLAVNAGGDITRFRTSVEHWYDDHMDRVSGWYKRRAAWITLAAGAILVLLLNINTITIGHALYGDSAVRSAVSTAAAKGSSCPASETVANCLSRLETEVSSAAQAGLPIGWGTVPACAEQGVHCGWLAQRGITNPRGGSPWQVILVLLGFLITIVALTPGAQFWFGLLVKLNSLRTSGPPPAPSATGTTSR